MGRHKISIIVAIFNGAKYLPKLLDSFLAQKSSLEIIIIDGASTDDTLNILKNFKKDITLVSEPDNGIYDAWNKGLKYATGEWIMFLGCDDTLLPDAIENYLDFIATLPDKSDIDIISSKIQMVDKRGDLIRVKGWPFKWPLFLKEMTIAHPGALHSRLFFERYGKFDINYKIVGDYELLLRAGKNLKALFMDKVTVHMAEGGVSDSVKAMNEHFKAVTKTGKHAFFPAMLNWGYVFAKFQIKRFLRRLGINFYLRKSNTISRIC